MLASRICGPLIKAAPIFRFPCQHLHPISVQRFMSSESYRQSSAPAWVPNRYPVARRGDHIDKYESKKQGGEVKIHDPYQWLESNSEETTKWIEGEFPCFGTTRSIAQQLHGMKIKSNLRKNIWKRPIERS